MRFIVLLVILLPLITYAATCSTDFNNPTILSPATVTAGETIYWRVRGIDPDANNLNQSVNIGFNTVLPWVSYGPQAADSNTYVFAPTNTDCDGNNVNLNDGKIVSRRVILSPPKNVSGNYFIDFYVTDGNTFTYWVLPVNVQKQGNKPPKSDGGRN